MCPFWFSNYLAEEQEAVALSILRVSWVGLLSVIVAIPIYSLAILQCQDQSRTSFAQTCKAHIHNDISMPISSRKEDF